MNRRIFTLVKKELLEILRDPKTRFSLMAPPIVQLFIFTFAATLDVKNVPIGVLNFDRGAKSHELIQRFRGAPTFTKIVELENEKEVKSFIDKQKGVMVLSMMEDFSKNVEEKSSAELQILLDGRKTNSSQIALNYAMTIVNQYNVETYGFGKVEVFTTTWFNPNLMYYWYNIPSLVATLSMLTCVIVTSISVAKERELGTFDQLLVSPLVPYEILIGKTLPGIIIGMCEGMFMFLMGVFVLGVPFTGSFLLFTLSLFVFITSISGIGLFILALSRTQQQAMVGSFVGIVPFILLSGFATPIENMPQWLQPVTYLIPLRYMLVISKGVFLKAMPARVVFGQLWPMVLIAAVNLYGAGAFFKRRLE